MKKMFKEEHMATFRFEPFTGNGSTHYAVFELTPAYPQRGRRVATIYRPRGTGNRATPAILEIKGKEPHQFNDFTVTLPADPTATRLSELMTPFF